MAKNSARRAAKKLAARKERLRQEKHVRRLHNVQDRREANTPFKIFKGAKDLYRTLDTEGSQLIYNKEQLKAEIYRVRKLVDAKKNSDPDKYYKLTTDGCDAAEKRIKEELEPKLNHIAEILDNDSIMRPGDGHVQSIYENISVLTEAARIITEIMGEFDIYRNKIIEFTRAADNPEYNPIHDSVKNDPSKDEEFAIKGEEIMNTEPKVDVIDKSHAEDAEVIQPDQEGDVSLDEVNEALKDIGQAQLNPEAKKTEAPKMVIG